MTTPGTAGSRPCAAGDGRAVCSAFATALGGYGVPEEVLTDNGKQFTDRFGYGGEVLFDRICRTNGIRHQLTRPASPTTTGKVERQVRRGSVWSCARGPRSPSQHVAQLRDRLVDAFARLQLTREIVRDVKRVGTVFADGRDGSGMRPPVGAQRRAPPSGAAFASLTSAGRLDRT